MEIRFNVTGARRKQLVVAVSEIVDAEPQYKGAPTFSYMIDYFTVDKNGTLIFDDSADSKVIENLVEQLAQQEFEAEPCADFADETIGLNIELPAEDISEPVFETLQKLVCSKAALIRKAIGTAAEIDVLKSDDRIVFPWFTAEYTEDEIKAYTQLCTALVSEARRLKRVNAKESETDNEKFAFRTFLVRIGMVGDEYKMARKILLKNLDGNSAFRHGRPENGGNQNNG